MPNAISSRFRRRLLFIAALALSAIAVISLAPIFSSPASERRMTHKVTRGDLRITIVEQGLLESEENHEIKCKVRGKNTILWVVESGTVVKPGDELLRLDRLFIEEQIDERTKYAHWSRSAAERSAADVARSKLAVAEYEQGRFVSEMMRKEKDLVISKSRLNSAREILSHTQQMAKSGYLTQLEVEEKDFQVKQAELDVEMKGTEIDVLERFTKKEQLQTLQGRLAAIRATHKANAERAMADASRRDRALSEIEHCTIKADRGGLVIHPNAARWLNAPRIAEGVVVHRDQVLLLMPNLDKMQVKIGVHESRIKQVQEGMTAQVALVNQKLEGTVSKVASITRPASWWNGNEVKYETLIKLPKSEGLRPGASAEVEILAAHYKDVLTVPVAAVVKVSHGEYCWVKTDREPIKRKLTLGDTNDIFSHVKEGLEEGEEILLNPMSLPEAKSMVEQDQEQDNEEPGQDKTP